MVTTIEDYKKTILLNDFQEYPLGNSGKQLLSKFLFYEEADIDLLIYLNVLILCRSYYGTYTAYYDDVKWFAQGFFNHQQNDFIKPHLTETIKVACDMILSDDYFTTGIIGTTFMFGVMEFYAKHKLGFNPKHYDFFDKKGKREYLQQLPVTNKKIDLSIKSAFEQLRGTTIPVAAALDEIDDFTTTNLMNAGIHSNRWHVYLIAERLNITRNPMLHGESHSFYNIGSYLVMLYTLFHLYDRREKQLFSTNQYS